MAFKFRFLLTIPVEVSPLQGKKKYLLFFAKAIFIFVWVLVRTGEILLD